MSAEANKVRVATVWLDGCSGCHMSFLDMDEHLIELSEKIQLVYSPLVDIKEYPEGVDVALVEGAISSEEDHEKILKIRERTKLLVALGDCAVTGNVPSMRNPFGTKKVLESVYLNGNGNVIPTEVVPLLLKHVRPIGQVVKVDFYVPGCPPSATTIWRVVSDLLEGRQPQVTEYSRFGA